MGVMHTELDGPGLLAWIGLVKSSVPNVKVGYDSFPPSYSVACIRPREHIKFDRKWFVTSDDKPKDYYRKERQEQNIYGTAAQDHY